MITIDELEREAAKHLDRGLFPIACDWPVMVSVPGEPLREVESVTFDAEHQVFIIEVA